MSLTHPIVQFGSVTFTGTAVKSVTVIEQVDPLATTLPITTCEIVLYSEDADFSLINPTGDYAALTYKQPITVYETVGATNVFIGQFYLDTWQNVSDTLIQLNCIDLICILDAYTYDGGIWLTATTMLALLTDILNDVGAAFELDPDLEAFELTGWLPICSYREALQQIAIAAGAYVMCARQNGYIKFGKTFLSGAIDRGVICGVTGCGQGRVRAQRWRPGQWVSLVPEIVITKAEKGSSQSLTKRTQVTGVEVTAHDIAAGTNNTELFNGTLTVGTHKVTFSQPMHTLTVTGATISESGANYAILTVASPGAVVLSGLVYIDTAKVFSVYDGTLPAGSKTNVLTVTNATLVNSTNAQDIAQRIYDYYAQRLLQKVKLYAPTASTGNVVVIDTLYGQQIRGVVEKMSIDLSGGFVVQADIVGVVDET
jgi:hypothetical protein